MRMLLNAATVVAFLLFALPAFAGNEGPSGKPADPARATPEPRPFSLERDSYPGYVMHPSTTKCRIQQNQVETTVTSEGQSSTSYAPVVYNENVPDFLTVQELVSQAETGTVTSKHGIPDVGTIEYTAQIAEGGPSVMLAANGGFDAQNSSPAAQTLVSFIGANCDQLGTPSSRKVLARMEIRAPYPRFVPQLFEIDADGSAIFWKDGVPQTLAKLSESMIGELQGEIEAMNVAPVVDPSPSAPRCLGGQSVEYVAVKGDGAGLVFARYESCHQLTRVDGLGSRTKTMLDGLRTLLTVSAGGSAPLTGIWGTPGGILTVNPDEISIDFGCGSARIPGVLMFDQNGHFEADGTTAPGGGPVPVGGVHASPAHFSGQLSGDTLTLAIMPGQGGGRLPATRLYTFRYGQIQFFARCE